MSLRFLRHSMPSVGCLNGSHSRSMARFHPSASPRASDDVRWASAIVTARNGSKTKRNVTVKSNETNTLDADVGL